MTDNSVSLVWNTAPEPGYTILTCVAPAVYPIPLLDTVIPVTILVVRSTVANAVAPTPSPVITTSGGPKYPLPPNVTIILSIFPLIIDGYATAPLPLIKLMVGSYVCCDPAFVMVILSTGPLQTAVAVAPTPPPPVMVIVGTLVYPTPPFTILIPVTVPSVICAVAYAWFPLVAPPPTIETLGEVVYPAPPLVTLIAVTEPVITTSAVGAKPSYSQSINPTVCIPAVCSGYTVAEDLAGLSALYLLP